MSGGPHYCPVDAPSMHVARAVCGVRHVAAPWTSEPLAVIRAEPPCRTCAAAARRDLEPPVCRECSAPTDGGPLCDVHRPLHDGAARPLVPDPEHLAWLHERSGGADVIGGEYRGAL